MINLCGYDVQAKVTYVRDEDSEYDVEYENGTVYTIKAKDVYKQTSAVLKRAERQRSKSRGRSPGRPARAAAAAVKKAVETPAESPAVQVSDLWGFWAACRGVIGQYGSVP